MRLGTERLIRDAMRDSAPEPKAAWYRNPAAIALGVLVAIVLIMLLISNSGPSAEELNARVEQSRVERLKAEAKAQYAKCVTKKGAAECEALKPAK